MLGFHTEIAVWLASQPGTVVFGMDAGAPDVDHPDPTHSEFAWPSDGGETPGEDLLLGPRLVDALGDALRRWLEAGPEDMAVLRAERPRGPLAVSHCIGGRPVRYDHIWTTDDVEVVRVDCDEAVAAGSDHALVVADLEL
jgi:hypothetical protein